MRVNLPRSNVGSKRDAAEECEDEVVQAEAVMLGAARHRGHTSAVTFADEVLAAAEKIADRMLLAEALLQRARLTINHLDHANGQDAVLTRAYLTALGGRRDKLATEALALQTRPSPN